ncbi:uncharacterized protein LOC113208015 [Frankliniella occidentalis]|uniref:Uncharacterized protein LOC113208015 n=1 Tax=Frankliniella occidentalis TaxID=133901 RepID=A0A6J1SIR6_FRAOC|nr:uncharacterized protein LOC113208015 [Frankliniella occidentalis]
MARFAAVLCALSVLVIALAFAEEEFGKPHSIIKRSEGNKFIKYHGVGEGATRSTGTLDKSGSGRLGQKSTGGKPSTSDGHSTVGGTFHHEVGSSGKKSPPKGKGRR